VVETHADAFGDATGEVLHEDIDPGGEPVEDRPSSGRLDVEHHRSLAAVGVGVHPELAVLEAVHLDHLGAVLGEDP
jgi:hypothetical protein